MQKLSNLTQDACYTKMNSPVGELTLVGSSKGLHAISWEAPDGKLTHNPQHPILKKAVSQLQEYFEGTRQTFDLPLVTEGTEFQQQAWQALRTIPYAKTLSYGEQAAKLGNKNKARAVGMANNKNPISIVIPCHRVIGSNGKLVGFGGGLDKKAKLLELEQAHA